ncbi:MAG: hypothetical protein JRF63_09945, partial [Deltaproteobacteria bacterium]|nr:hypothetical protein [Deltaproteobacteria bacterium]
MTMPLNRFQLALLAMAATIACCGKAPEPPATRETASKTAMVSASPKLVRDRPFLLGPRDDPESRAPVPLVVLLHGYGAPSVSLSEALGIESKARSAGFVYAVPDGT